MREGTECLRTILSQDPFIEARTTARESLAIKRFSDLCNTFGDHDEEIANAILVDEKNKKHFLMLAAGCMASLGYAGECEKRMQREHWDLRNKAATEYCLKHLETLIVCLCAESLPACELPWKSRRSNRNTRLCSRKWSGCFYVGSPGIICIQELREQVSHLFNDSCADSRISGVFFFAVGTWSHVVEFFFLRHFMHLRP